MSDLVSKQAVLDALDSNKYSKEFCEEHNIDWSINLGMAHIAVNELETINPSAENKGEPIECARALKKHCINTKDYKECFMWNECKYELSAPCDWDLPDGEKGGE